MLSETRRHRPAESSSDIPSVCGAFRGCRLFAALLQRISFFVYWGVMSLSLNDKPSTFAAVSLPMPSAPFSFC